MEIIFCGDNLYCMDGNRIKSDQPFSVVWISQHSMKLVPCQRSRFGWLEKSKSKLPWGLGSLNIASNHSGSAVSQTHWAFPWFGWSYLRSHKSNSSTSDDTWTTDLICETLPIKIIVTDKADVQIQTDKLNEVVVNDNGNLLVDGMDQQYDSLDIKTSDKGNAVIHIAFIADVTVIASDHSSISFGSTKARHARITAKGKSKIGGFNVMEHVSVDALDYGLVRAGALPRATVDWGRRDRTADVCIHTLG